MSERTYTKPGRWKVEPHRNSFVATCLHPDCLFDTEESAYRTPKKGSRDKALAAVKDHYAAKHGDL